MAKFTKKTEEEKMESVDIQEEVKVEVKPEIETKVITTPIIQMSDVKTVKIKPNFTGNKYVGDTWYHFIKGEMAVVPKHVKDILVEQKGIEAI